MVRLVQIGLGGWGRDWAKEVLPDVPEAEPVAFVDGDPAMRELARETGAELVEVECVLDRAIAKERIARRLANPDNPSDATPDLVDHMAASREHWPEAIAPGDLASTALVADVRRARSALLDVLGLSDLV